MAYSLSFDQIGFQPVGVITAPDTTRNHPQGLIVSGSDPWWGGGEFKYVQANGTIRQYGIVVLTQTQTAAGIQYMATEAPTTQNLGRELGISMFPMVAGQFGWVQIGGVTPVNCNASVAADTTFGIASASAGQGGANSAGRQVLNSRIVLAGANTVVKANVVTRSGSNIIFSPNGTDGWFPGAFLSGTGIPASTIVGTIDPDGRTVSMFQSGTTTAQNATATGSVSVTATYNNATIFYNVASINRPFAQGAIT